VFYHRCPIGGILGLGKLQGKYMYK